MMLALTVVLVGTILLVFYGWIDPILANWAIILIIAALCWQAGKEWRLAFWAAVVLNIALAVESIPALRAQPVSFYLFLLFYVVYIPFLWRLPLRQTPRISAVFCILLTLLTAVVLFFAWQVRQATLQAMAYAILTLAALWVLSPAMETALAGRAPMGRFFLIISAVIGWLAGVLHSVLAPAFAVPMESLRALKPIWVASDLLFGIGVYCEAKKIDVRLWPFMAVGALGIAWMTGLLTLRSVSDDIYQVWMLLGGMVLFICSLGVARGYEAALYLARSRLENWLAIIDDLSRAADENADTGHSLEQAFMHMMAFLTGLLGLEIVFKSGSLLLGKAEGHREVLRAEDGREIALYALDGNLMTSEEMWTARTWLISRLWDIAIKLELRGQAFLDPLSGLLNRRAYEARLSEVLHLAQVQQRPLAILMVDLDHFKRVNDTCGHAMGDQVLQAVAQTMRAFFRAEDLVVRWGGEEFLVIIVGVDRNQAVERAEQLREAIGMLAVPAVPWPLSASIGVAGGAVPQNEAQFERWLKEADEAAYAAKRAGRNRVMQCQASDAA
jgi:diguanylate cyclase (GGDEF)-like protein